MYEGDVMFEHCYRLDIDAAVPPPEKRVCWERWLATNTRGQTRDRVEFAAARSRSLMAGPNASGVAFLRVLDPSGGDAAPATSVACPLPETPFEPPPPTLAAVPAKASAAALVPPAPAVSSSAALVGKPRGRPCFDACGADLAGCASKCANARCSQKCADEVKKCMGTCT